MPKPPASIPSHLTLSQAARLAGVSRQAISRAIAAGRLESEDVLGAPMVRTSAVCQLWQLKAHIGVMMSREELQAIARIGTAAGERIRAALEGLSRSMQRKPRK